MKLNRSAGITPIWHWLLLLFLKSFWLNFPKLKKKQTTQALPSSCKQSAVIKPEIERCSEFPYMTTNVPQGVLNKWWRHSAWVPKIPYKQEISPWLNCQNIYDSSWSTVRTDLWKGSLWPCSMKDVLYPNKFDKLMICCFMIWGFIAIKMINPTSFTINRNK